MANDILRQRRLPGRFRLGALPPATKSRHCGRESIKIIKCVSHKLLFKKTFFSRMAALYVVTSWLASPPSGQSAETWGCQVFYLFLYLFGKTKYYRYYYFWSLSTALE